MAIVDMDGQHSPWSLALSASEIKTDLGVGGIWSGQQALITAVDIVNPQREGGLSVAIPTAAALMALLGATARLSFGDSQPHVYSGCNTGWQ